VYKYEGDDKIINSRGDVMAQKIHGEWDTKNPEVLEFIARKEKPKKKTAKKVAVEVKEELEMVRARDENGHFIADDPDTEVNEAWVVKTAKKIAGKK